MASEAAAAEELSFVEEASIAAKSPVAEDALVEEEPLGADATGAAATAAKAVAPKDVEPQGIEFNQKETKCPFVELISMYTLSFNVTEVCDRGAAVTALEHSSNDVCKCYSLNDDVKMEANVVETVSNVVCPIFYLLYQKINIFTDNFFFYCTFFTLWFLHILVCIITIKRSFSYRKTNRCG